MFERVRSWTGRIKTWWKYRQAWEVEDVEYDYKRVVRQSSGFVVHVRECRTLVNQMDGSEKVEYEEVDTVWMDTQWSVGGPVRWDEEYVFPDNDAMMFGDVARGYQR